ncbi:MAG: aromatic aminobenezylarsenical efflux permease ArsG family transporter [Bacteroidales bacterium]
MEFLTGILESSRLPWLSALLLGLMTAISPCPLATNITAIGYISRELDNRHRVFLNGLLYTFGRGISYFTIALVIFLGADQLSLSGFFQRYGEKILGPLLIIIGLFMLDFLRVNFPSFNSLSSGFQNKKRWGSLDAILLGILFALAFCPYSGVLYFGMLAPMTISSPQGLYLPFVFALATGIPVIIVSWILAYTLSGIGTFYRKLQLFEKWFRRIIAVLFIIAGMYYVVAVFF